MTSIWSSQLHEWDRVANLSDSSPEGKKEQLYVRVVTSGPQERAGAYAQERERALKTAERQRTLFRQVLIGRCTRAWERHQWWCHISVTAACSSCAWWFVSYHSHKWRSFLKCKQGPIFSASWRYSTAELRSVTNLIQRWWYSSQYPYSCTLQQEASWHVCVGCPGLSAVTCCEVSLIRIWVWSLQVIKFRSWASNHSKSVKESREKVNDSHYQITQEWYVTRIIKGAISGAIIYALYV